MTRLVLALLVISTFIVAGILFYPKQQEITSNDQSADPWAEEQKQPKTKTP